MRRGRRLPKLELSDEQRTALQGWTRRRKTAQALSMRARIVMRASEGLTATAIARETQACIQTVSKWWRRFDEQGLDGLLDEPRPGQPRKLSDAQIEQVISAHAGEQADGVYPLVNAYDGRSHGHEPNCHQPHLARLFACSPSRRDIQVIQRPVVHRQGARHRGSVHEPARTRPGLMRG